MRVVLFWYVSKTAPSPASMYTAVYTYVRMSCFFWVGILQFFVRTYLVCVASSRPILLVRTSFHTVFSCDNNSVFITLHSEHQQIFWWDVSNSVLRHPVSYIVSAYLVSYCLLVRQQQRFHHPTLRTSTVILVACIEQSTISGKHVHCCILVHVSCFFGGVGMFPVIVRTYLVCVASSRVLFC